LYQGRAARTGDGSELHEKETSAHERSASGQAGMTGRECALSAAADLTTPPAAHAPPTPRSDHMRPAPVITAER